MGLSISLAGHGQFMKMLITLEPHGISSLNFVVFLYCSFSLFLRDPFSRLFIHFKVFFGISN